MHGNEVFQRVRHALAQVEAERNVRVLFACESGSRAWGFASRDSDYDVRFLYVHRRDWYLSVEDRRDVIEQPIANDLDLSGWELRKALRLLRPGGIVAFDNALWHDRVADPAQRDAETVAIRELGRSIADNDNVVPVLLPVGDGLLLAQKR